MKKVERADKRMLVWVGFSDGSIHVDKDPDYKVDRLNVFPTRAAAKKCYADVRPAWLEINKL